MGNNQDPITLHKYLYANTDPGNMVDPSGHMVSLGSVMSGINVMSRLVTTAIRVSGTKLGSSAIGRAIKATGITAIGALIKNEVKRCYTSRGKRCRIPNLVVIGSDYSEAQKHIDDAQKGRGSNGFPISPLVTYKRGANKSRDWLRRTEKCTGNVFRESGKSCDEYPFAASKEGGQKRYRQNKVSLRLIDHSQNTRAGHVYGRAVTKGKNGDKYLIAPYGPFSFYYSNGKFGL